MAERKNHSQQEERPADHRGDMSGLSQQDHPEVVVATSGRSSCQTCGESIGKGENRVGMVGRSSGVSCMKARRPRTRLPAAKRLRTLTLTRFCRRIRQWMHPQCFALNMRIEYAPTGRARCNADRDGALIGKGEPRLLMRMMKTSCGGEVVAKARPPSALARALALPPPLRGTAAPVRWQRSQLRA